MPYIQIWDKETAEKELLKRLTAARIARVDLEHEWEECERAVYGTVGFNSAPNVSISFESESELGVTGVDNSTTNIGSNYIFKNLRFIHSQMSANPPSVVPRPTSNDLEDRRKADAADRLIRYGLRQYNLQDTFDVNNLSTLIYGNGPIKEIFNPDKGEILETDEATGELLMEGDIEIASITPWNFWIDPDAVRWEDVTYVFERILMHYEEACYRFGPEAKDILEALRIQQGDDISMRGGERSSTLKNRKYDVIEVFQYWEKGLPYNGMIGRFCYCTKDGKLLSEVKPNPHRFAPPAKEGEAPRPGIARLPYHLLTDVDVPNRVWGKSVVIFVSQLQETLNRLDNVTMDNIQAHGVARMILPEGTEVKEDSITNSPWDIIKTSGNNPPHFMEPLPVPSIIPEMRNQIKQVIDDIMGVNESMFGQQSRETSGFSMQYATNQGNMIRRRLFNKYVTLVEQVYKDYLSLIRKHWSEPRTILTLGKEKAFEAIDIKGTDINGGFDLVVEYGASLSLDPTTRRQEIITLMPLFEKAGLDTKTLLSMMKLNELDNMYDRTQMAADRQREIFEEMLAKDIYIPPAELANHKDMLIFAYDYVMTVEYKYLTPEQKSLIDRHIRARESLAAAGAQPPGTGQQTPGPLPVGQPEGQPPNASADVSSGQGQPQPLTV